MRSAALNPGDHVQVNVRGVTFPATVRSNKGKGLVGIDPDEPRRFTWRSVPPSYIVKKLEGVGA